MSNKQTIYFNFDRNPNLINITEPFKNEEGLLETDLQLDHLQLIRIQSSKKEDEDEDI